MLFDFIFGHWRVSRISPYTHLSAGFGGDLKRGLEGSPLLGGEDGAWSFGPAGVFAVIAAFSSCRTLLWLHIHIFVLTFILSGHKKKVRLSVYQYMFTSDSLVPCRIWCYLSRSCPDWLSWAAPSPSHSRSYTAADLLSEQTGLLCTAGARRRSSRSSWGGKHSPELALPALWVLSSPDSRCT